MSERALILVDLQNDFCAGGALAVPDGDAVVPVANALSPHFRLVVATQDSHPPNHLSFASQHPGKQVYDRIELDGLEQVLWPDHCIEGTHGAALHPQLSRAQIRHVVPKGTDERIDSYSGFFDNGHRKATGLDAYLKAEGVSEIVLMGLATDFCVKWTGLDAVALGYRVTLVTDGCRGVGLTPDDVPSALRELAARGVILAESAQLLG